MTPGRPSFDVVILGAGIVGSSCAFECTRLGLKVAIVEPGVPGGGATAAGMGHLVAMDDSPAQLALTHYSRALWQALAASLPASVEYTECGTLWVATDDEEMAEVQTKHRTYSDAGLRSEILDSSALEAAEPCLRRGLAGALLVPGDGVIYPPAAADFLLREACHAGAIIIRGQRAISAGNGKVSLTDQTSLVTDHILVATGTDLSLLPWLPIQMRKGHLVITDRYPGLVKHQLVELGYLKSAHKVQAASVAFNVQPRKTGQLLIGSSRQYGDEDPGADPAILSQMLARAESYLPGLRTLSALRVWTGFRAATPDKLPLLGPTEDRSVILAVGFEGLGITNAPGAARLVVDHLLGRPSAIDRTPYLPSRVSVVAHA